MTTDRTSILLSAIDNALRNGSYMTGANLAFELLCDDAATSCRSCTPSAAPSGAQLTLPW